MKKSTVSKESFIFFRSCPVCKFSHNYDDDKFCSICGSRIQENKISLKTLFNYGTKLLKGTSLYLSSTGYGFNICGCKENLKDFIVVLNNMLKYSLPKKIKVELENINNESSSLRLKFMPSKSSSNEFAYIDIHFYMSCSASNISSFEIYYEALSKVLNKFLDASSKKDCIDLFSKEVDSLEKKVNFYTRGCAMYRKFVSELTKSKKEGE